MKITKINPRVLKSSPVDNFCLWEFHILRASSGSIMDLPMRAFTRLCMKTDHLNKTYTSSVSGRGFSATISIKCLLHIGHGMTFENS